MLVSMTGFGEERRQVGDWHVSIELRSVNNRHFKLNLRCPDSCFHYEAEIEKLLRETVSRGTVSLTIRMDMAAGQGAPVINKSVVIGYWNQLRDLSAELGLPESPRVVDLLSMPGVLGDGRLTAEQVEQLWPEISNALRVAVAKFNEFRHREGTAMAAELRNQCLAIGKELDDIVISAPKVVDDYREKLHERMLKLLDGTQVMLDRDSLVREVALFADRCDIHEEIARLRSHLSQFMGLLETSPSQGRKLDFLCQEIFRESNTIGSKANHVGIAHGAVEMKTCVERIRELVANVE